MIGIRRRLDLVLLVAMIVSLCPGIASAQGTPAPIATLAATSSVEVAFPQGITITADLAWVAEQEPDEIALTYSLANETIEHLATVDTSIVPGETATTATATLDFQSPFVPTGIAVRYQWRLERDEVVIAESPIETTAWLDTRWTWNLQETDQVRVHSYDLSEDFVAEIVDSAQETVTDLEQRFGLDRSAPLDIWVYSTREDMLGAQQANSRESIAGASYPGYELIVALIPEGNQGEIGRIIPHEVSHQILYQATQNPFTYPPIWFDEGLATHMQVGGTDAYADMVESALDDGTLFDLTSLEATFPFTPSQATLAYAASWSAVEYIMQTYGDDGIAALIDAYGQGLSNDAAIRLALGIGSDELSANWKAWVDTQAGSDLEKVA